MEYPVDDNPTQPRPLTAVFRQFGILFRCRDSMAFASADDQRTLGLAPAVERMGARDPAADPQTPQATREPRDSVRIRDHETPCRHLPRLIEHPQSETNVLFPRFEINADD